MGLIPRYHLFSRHKLHLALYPDQHRDCAVTGLPVPVYFARNFPHISSVIEPGDFRWALAVGAFSTASLLARPHLFCQSRYQLLLPEMMAYLVVRAL